MATKRKKIGGKRFKLAGVESRKNTADVWAGKMRDRSESS
ncbi:hypothetical protein LCGC14_1835720 [marine sediment metagenome]|uniref:Uncharacterized protein n=1 Tax=marine sediment metagenome TaxID=412755 RepID=A0A0F9GEZ3_9ZZZZ